MNKTVNFSQLIDKLPQKKMFHGGSKHDATKPQVLQENSTGEDTL